MSNPNTSALSIASRKASSNGMHTVHIGKDSQPVNLVQMSSVNSHSWQKSASFECLKRTVYSLASSHSVADLIALASSELPLDTGSAFQESQSASLLITSFEGLFQFLDPVAFLTSTGKEIKIDDPDDLKKRPEDISFM